MSKRKAKIRIDFECKRKIETESNKGVVYKVYFKSNEGHGLVLKGDSLKIFEGFPIGTKITVELVKPQTLLVED